MRIFVCGNSGFLAQAFKEKQGKKHAVTINTQLNLNSGVEVRKYFQAEKFDGCVYFNDNFDGKNIEESNIDEDNIKENNLDSLTAFKNVQYAAILSGVKKLILINENKISEESTVCKEGEQNSINQRLIALAAKSDKITSSLNIFNVYGGGMNVFNNKINEMCARGIMGSKDIIIKKDRLFNAVYYEDVLKIIAILLESEAYKGEYDIAADNQITFAEIAKKVKAYAKKNLREVNIKIKSEEVTEQILADNQKIKDALPDFKFTNITSGISKTLNFLLENKAYCKSRVK